MSEELKTFLVNASLLILGGLLTVTGFFLKNDILETKERLKDSQSRLQNLEKRLELVEQKADFRLEWLAREVKLLEKRLEERFRQ